MRMRLPIKWLLLSGFLCVVAKEVVGLYFFCQPPLALEGAEGNSVVWDLRDAPAVDLCLFLATTRRAPPAAALRPGAPPGKSHVRVSTFEGIVPASSPSAPDAYIEALELPEGFFRNGTVFLHALAVPHGQPDAAPLRHEVVVISRQVVQPSRRVRRRYLLGAPPAGAERDLQAEAAEAAIGSSPVASIPKVVEVGFVAEPRPLNRTGLRSQGFDRYVQGQHLRLPLAVNTLVSPRDEYAPLLKDGKAPSLELRLRNVGLGYWTLIQQFDMAFDDAEKTMGLNSYDADSFKQMIGGSSPWKIVLVYSIAILHLAFEYLAFASDINFWRAKTSFEGLSSSTVALQACSNIIMFLYVKEQGQTKFVMYFIAFRFCLQLWKLRKLTTFRRCPGWPYVRWVSRAGVEGDSGLEELQDIDAAERKCLRGLMLVLLPVVAAFCVYRLIYERFRSWYSWLVLSLAVCAQMGGFVVMTPQVFMNYRLKSVEHLPWRALTYQAINTFVDDVFTLCIRMPEIQKYGVFRDDIVFIICCVQRWLYRKPPAAAGGGGGGAADGAEKEVAEPEEEAKGDGAKKEE